MKIRKLLQLDLPDISRIQRECYSDHFIESADSFSAKLSAHSEFCFMAEQDETASGYVVALPWVFGEIPDLNGLEYPVPPHADGVYLHDIAVSPAARKSGAAGKLLNAVLEAVKSQGYKRVFLVAIQGAAAYWQRHGFEAVQAGAELQRRLSGYGEGATYMVRVNDKA